MLPMHVPQPRLTGSLWSVFGLGVFSGASTACCAPVLAGAIALSATSGTIAGGLLLGVAYVTGMMAPLIPIALFYGRLKRRVSDPMITLRIGSHAKRIGVVRLAGVVIFAGFGALFITLAMTGNSNTAPGFQKALGGWMRGAGIYVARIPNVVSLPILAVVVAAFVLAVVKKRKADDESTSDEVEARRDCWEAERDEAPRHDDHIDQADY